ncbi:hypothetical protein DERF_006370 [Dermatophagoides farinae]|uniref:Uncharacterized protein n=1 Tax=Dermatophagoides farinae TaxID=6954 RepID=A0A922I7C4_DERFA|nr:hypothetical protein DERF_006370 [Dermatophagoides farinae]
MECTLANFQQCISGLWSTSNNNNNNNDGNGDLAFPITSEQLKLTCEDLKKRVRCLDSHSERCFTHEMMQVFGHIVTNAKQFVHDLCDDKKVQAEYLIHAKCFRNISLDEQKCAHEYRDAIALPPIQSQPVHSPPSQYRLSIVDLIDSNSLKPNRLYRQKRQLQMKEIIMRRTLLCKRLHVREQCGQSASIFMRDHLPLLEQHCQAYTYGPGTCDEALYGIRGRIINTGNDDDDDGDDDGDGKNKNQNNAHQQQTTKFIRPSHKSESTSSGTTIILQRLKQQQQQQQQRQQQQQQQNRLMKMNEQNLQSSNASINLLKNNLFIIIMTMAMGMIFLFIQ